MEAHLLEVVVAVTKNFKNFVFISASVLANQAHGEKLIAGKWKSKFLFNFYDQDSNNGAQVYDDSGEEGVTVIEPMIFISHQIDATTNMSGHFVLDAWSAESDTILDDKTGESGAGKVNQARVSGNISYSKDIAKTILTPRIGFSSEYDYKSFNGGISVETPFAKDNFTLGVSADVFMDSVNLFDYDKEKTKDAEDKRVYAYNISASQILTPSDIILFNISHIRQTGALESIRNTTKISGTRYAETLPDERIRSAFTTQFVHGFSDEKSISLKYRYYTDDWDMTANTAELSYRQFVQDELGFFELNYRYHDQKSVKYFARTLSAKPEFFTSDSDQDSFDAHRIGGLYSYNVEDKKFMNLNFDKWEYSVALYHYFRSNELKYNIIQASLGVEF